MSLISKLATAAALALSLAASASHAATIQNYPKEHTPRFATYNDMAIRKAAKVAAEDTLKYVVEETNNVCGNTGKNGANVKVLIRASNGRLVLLKTYGVPEDGVVFASTAFECK